MQTYTVPKAESDFFPCNYQNHNGKEIVPFFLYLTTKETFPLCPNATLPQKKYFFIMKPTLPCHERNISLSSKPPLKSVDSAGIDLVSQGDS